MAQTGYTPILLYASGTSGNTPSAANLTSSSTGAELALNYADGKVFYKNGSGTVLQINSSAIANTGGWSVTPSGTKLYFNYNGTNVGSLDSSGNFIALGNVTAFGTP